MRKSKNYKTKNKINTISKYIKQKSNIINKDMEL